jgi:hypothetical protein
VSVAAFSSTKTEPVAENSGNETYLISACDLSEISRCHVSGSGCIDCLELGFVLFLCSIPHG